MAQGSGSYYDDYMRSNALLKHCGEKNAKKLLTDRNAYISFLEVQLERVSAACLSTQTFEKRLAELENAQSVSDQKVGALSKVFRLNQEYVEQTSQQAQSELATYTAKVDAWMEKFSVELERQQPRMVTLEEQFHQCQDYLPRLVETNDAALQDVKNQAEHDIEELRAHVFALENTIEEIHSCQATTDSKVETLTNTTTDKLDKELALVRSSVSEKNFQLDRTVIQLRNDLEQLMHQVDASWRAEVSKTTDSYEAHVGELQQRLDQLHQEIKHGHTEVKDVLKKCLDTQHLLSGSVVELQSEVDTVKNEGAVTAHKDSETVSAAMENLLERQNTLKNAMQLLQACAMDAQQASEDHYSKLADRLDTVEDSFEARTDDLRRRMLTALEEVGERFHAGTSTDNTLQAVRKEFESQFAHVMEFSTTFENRVRVLEHTVLSLETKVQRSRAIAEVLDPGQTSEVHPAEITELLMPPFNKTPIGEDSGGTVRAKHELQKRSLEWDSERYYQHRIRELEERLRLKSQIVEEHCALFPEHSCSKTSPKSSISSVGNVSSFVMEEESKHRDVRGSRRTRPALKKNSVRRSSKAAQSKVLKPTKGQTSCR